MNLHTPERQPNESQQQYRARQKASRASRKTLVYAWSGNGPYVRANDREVGAKLPSRRDLHRLASKTFTHKAKPLAFRRHKPHQHPKDGNGMAFTLIGARHPITGARRVWLAGISAQRGY